MARKVLIIGSGAFGLSAAYHLLQSGLYNVTILERHPSGLAPDAASSDLNKIVRSDYPDLVYAKLAREAIQRWKDPMWGGVYHETGVLVIGDDSPTGQYTTASLEQSRALDCRVVPATDRDALSACFPQNAPLPVFRTKDAYVNRDGGWVEASAAMEILAITVREMGGKVQAGKRVIGLSKDERGQVDGAVLADGETLHAGLVVVACGSWTPSMFPDMGLPERLLATGQSEVFIQLDPRETKVFHDNPVVLDWSTGISIFPPTKCGLVKLGIHHGGYTNPYLYVASGKSFVVSTPITSEEGDTKWRAVPREVIDQFRQWIRSTYPSLADKPFVDSRMCWYTDTPDGDWLIDFHPEHPNLLFATGGSGHAFKFLPTLGSLVQQRIEGSLSPDLGQKFSWNKQTDGKDMSRVGEHAKVLRMDHLAVSPNLEEA